MTSSLDFEEFTWEDEESVSKSISPPHFALLTTYLKTEFPTITKVEEHMPYLIIRCHPAIPETSERPLKIAGLLAIWLIDNRTDELPEELFGGSEGNPDILLHLTDAEMRDDIRAYRIPKSKTRTRLIGEACFADVDVVGVSFIGNTVFVELAAVGEKEHEERVGRLPGEFGHEGGPGLRYWNGLRPM